MHFTLCTSLYALHSMRFTLCTSLHALDATHFTLCTSLSVVGSEGSARKNPSRCFREKQSNLKMQMFVRLETKKLNCLNVTHRSQLTIHTNVGNSHTKTKKSNFKIRAEALNFCLAVAAQLFVLLLLSRGSLSLSARAKQSRTPPTLAKGFCFC